METGIYVLAAWNIGTLIYVILAETQFKIPWPTIDTVARHNTVAKWTLVASFGISLAIAFRFTIAPTFNSFAFLDLCSKLLSFSGFYFATYAILGSEPFKKSLSQYAVNIFGWSLLGVPLGFAIGGGILSFWWPNGSTIGHLGLNAIFCSGPIITMLELTKRKTSDDDKLKWFAAVLVLTGHGLQIYISGSRFIDL